MRESIEIHFVGGPLDGQAITSDPATKTPPRLMAIRDQDTLRCHRFCSPKVRGMKDSGYDYWTAVPPARDRPEFYRLVSSEGVIAYRHEIREKTLDASSGEVTKLRTLVAQDDGSYV